MRRRRLGSVLAAATALLTSAGCADSGDAAPLAAATAFRQHIDAGEGGAACALLSATTLAELESSTGKPCETALLEEQLPAVEEHDEVARFGSMAQVRYAGEVVFLSRYEDGWRVTAAGCVPAVDDVYECKVKGR